MKIEFEIKDEDIINVLIGALEGGSNYWYKLSDGETVVKEWSGN